jgi:membrane associated rhomboid family serine protease
MGIYDRDYYRQSAESTVGHMQMLSVTTWLIIINVAVAIIDPILFNRGHGLVYVEQVQYSGQIRDLPSMPPMQGLGHFSILLGIQKLEIWRFITFQFLHAGMVHLVLNMIALFFFGPLVEEYLGSRRFLAFYLLCGIGGPIAYTFLYLSHILIEYSWTPLIGASAGIFGTLIAAARIAPNETVVIYGIIPMRLKTLAWILFGIAAFTVLRYGNSGQANAGGEAAHLGGAAVGFLLIENHFLLRWPDLNRLRLKKPPF